MLHLKRHRNRLGRRIAATALGTVALLVLSGGVALADDTTPSPAPTAPPAFAGQLDGLYSQMVATIDGAGNGPAPSQLLSTDDFSSLVAGLTPEELGEIYAATQTQAADWSELPVDLQNIQDAEASAPPPAGQSQVAPAAKGVTAVPSPKPKAAAAPSTASLPALAPADTPAVPDFPLDEPIGMFPDPPAPYLPSPPVSPHIPLVCPAGAPGGPDDEPGETSLFATQLVIDTAAFVAAVVPDSITVGGNGYPDPAKYVVAAVSYAASVIHDTFAYLQSVFADCQANDLAATAANIDATTVNSFQLESLLESTINATEASVNTIHAQVHVAQQTLDAQLTLSIQQALTAPTTSIPNLAYELPASVGGNLNSVPIGVQAIVSTAVYEAQSAGVAINAQTTKSLASANAALAAKSYKSAYKLYQQAYQQAAA